MAKAKQASVEDVKKMAVEQPVNEKEKDVENPSPLSGPAIAPAQKEGGADRVEKEGLTVPADGVERTAFLTGRPEVPPEDKKDTPVVNVEHKNGQVVAVDAPVKEYADETVNVREGENVRADAPPTKVAGVAEGDENLAKIDALQKEVNDLHKKMRDADKRVGDLLKERDALKKEILESPAEKLRAELEVARREYELLLGNQQKPAVVHFG